MPRKTLDPFVAALIDTYASMRPRPDAAENLRCEHRERRASVVASMRPRPDAAENAGSRAGPR